MNSSDEKKRAEIQDARRTKQRDWILSEIRKRIPDAKGVGCVLCKLIYEDLEQNPKLTGYPNDANGAPIFPRAGKIEHLKLEGLYLPT
jgi:hypothetical protein